jgi:hypothetical protein
MLRQHKLNGNMIFAEHSSNLMQRLPHLPSTPHLIALLLRQLEPLLKSHKHHLIEKDLYQMVLHRPVELARLLGNWEFMLDSGFSPHRVAQLAQKPQFQLSINSLIWRVPISKFCLPRNRCFWTASEPVRSSETNQAVKRLQ